VLFAEKPVFNIGAVYRLFFPEKMQNHNLSKKYCPCGCLCTFFDLLNASYLADMIILLRWFLLYGQKRCKKFTEIFHCLKEALFVECPVLNAVTVSELYFMLKKKN